MEVNTVYLSLGSNLGNRKQYLSDAIDRIEKMIGTIIKCSAYYETPPLGFTTNDQFINCALSISTKQSPREVLASTQTIEQEIGRKEKTRDGYQSRIIDIDIILFGSKVINENDLQIPHKEYSHRKFVLIPLAEIAPNIVDPSTHLTIDQLIRNCSDKSEIQLAM